MHRPPARRARRLAVALTALLAGSPACSDDDRAADVVAVEVAAQPCDRPTRDLGVGVLVGPGLVATAAHTVEGPRRQLTVDGSPARVAALDARTDLALLAADVGGTPAEATPDDLDRGTLRTLDGDLQVRVLRTGPLVVDDTTAGTRHERTVHTFTPGADPGASGAPLLDARGRLAGIVVLTNRTDGTGYAVTAGELLALIDSGRGSPAPVRCPG